MKVKKIVRNNTFAKLAQHAYLTFLSYTRNSLFESAASCSFGFVFSFIPIIMLALSLLSGILVKYPSMMNYIVDLANEFSDIFDINLAVSQLTKKKTFTWVDIILGVWIIWVARRFFLSIARGISRIFHSETPQKGYVIQLMTFIGEFALIVGLIAIVLFSFVLQQFLELPTFTTLAEKFPFLFADVVSILPTIIFYAIIFIFTTVVYRFESRTAPHFLWCLICAAMSTGCFWVVSFFINKFMNVSNYILIYGTISSVIILMLKSYIFFMLFLFFAQSLYVYQFFETLLFGELYLLPDAKSMKISDIAKRIILFNPALPKSKTKTIKFKAGDIIFKKGDKADFVYFIKSGIIREEFDDRDVTFAPGVFFGEKSCVLKRKRSGTTSATTDAELIRISAEEFRNLLMKNPRASAYAMGKWYI